MTEKQSRNSVENNSNNTRNPHQNVTNIEYDLLSSHSTFDQNITGSPVTYWSEDISERKEVQ